MYVLLPPSETKAPGGDGPSLDLAALGFLTLNPVRAEVIDRLTELCADPARARPALGVSARQDAEISATAKLRSTPTTPALRRYTGVLYDNLDVRSLPPAGRTGPPGAREALVAALHSRTARILTHPLFVLPTFIASFAVLYFTPLFGVLVGSHVGHLVMNLHFLLVGYLYYWVIIGVDPAPRRLP